MSKNTFSYQRNKLAPGALSDAWNDFTLSRQAMNCTPATMEFYHHTARRFVGWSQARGVTSPDQITAKHVREFLAQLSGDGCADTTLHDNARAIKTLLRFWHSEGYLPAPVTFPMPKVGQKRLPVLTADNLETVLAACDNKRDAALIAFLADTGVRREEAIALDWSDIDFSSGLVKVRRGKGNKARSVVIGPTTRRALLKYRRTQHAPQDDSPVFLSRPKKRMTSSAITLLFRRVAKRTGIHITAHALRRTFAILSLRAGMDVLHLQALLGHSDLEMVQHYAAMVDDDLLQSHRRFSPIENLPRLKAGKEGKRHK